MHKNSSINSSYDVSDEWCHILRVNNEGDLEEQTTFRDRVHFKLYSVCPFRYRMIHSQLK